MLIENNFHVNDLFGFDLTNSYINIFKLNSNYKNLTVFNFDMSIRKL